MFKTTLMESFEDYWYSFTMSDESQSWPASLNKPPEIIYAGIGKHGHAEQFHSYYFPETWCLHVYHYHGELKLEESYALHPNVISIIPPKTSFTHIWRLPNSTHAYILFQLRKMEYEKVSLPFLTKGSPDSFPVAFERVSAFLRQPHRTQAWLWDFLFLLHSQQSRSVSDNVPHPAIKMTVEKIEESLHNRINVAELARNAGISHNHLTRLFKNALGTDIIEYIATRRWERAERLLKSTNMAIKQIAYELAFNDLSHFNKFVHNRCGMSPRHYRNANRI